MAEVQHKEQSGWVTELLSSASIPVDKAPRQGLGGSVTQGNKREGHWDSRLSGAAHRNSKSGDSMLMCL